MHNLLVFSRRSVFGFQGGGLTEEDHKNELFSLEKGVVHTFPDCWLRVYPTDAHCVMYTWKLPVRVNKAGLYLVKEQGFEPMMNWLMVDVDNVEPGTKVKRPWSSREDFLDRLKKLLAYPVPELDYAGVYQTANGFRLLWPLANPIPVSFGDSLLRQFVDYLTKAIPFHSIALSCDDKCCDWTRLMRMPRVHRDDTGTDQMLYINIDHMQPLAWTPSEALLQEATKAYPRVKDISDYTLRPVDPEILHLLRGSPFYDAIVAHRPLSVPTDRTPAMMRAIGSVSIRLNTTNPDDIFQVLAPCILADDSIGPTGRPAPTLADLARACAYTCRNRVAELGAESTAQDTLLLHKIADSLLPRSTTPSPVAPVQGTVILPPPVETTPVVDDHLPEPPENIDNDFRFQTANEKRQLLEEVIHGRYPGHDVGWLRFLEVVPDKIDKAGEIAARGGFKGTVRNICLILQNDPRWRNVALYWNELANDIYYQNPPTWPRYVASNIPRSRVHAWLAPDMWRFSEWLKVSEYGFEVKNQDDIERAILLSAQKDSRHPVRQYLSSLQWDGYSRLDSMLPELFCVEPSKLSFTVGRCWMISAVARVFHPGCKVDTVLVLGGKQGKQKSTAMQALCPNGEWVFDSEIEIGQKDAYQVLQGSWIVEWAELSRLDKTKIDATKRFLSSRIDKFRPSYGAKVETFPRQCVVFATSNDRHYLTDPENRRYWTVTVKDTIDINKIISVRDQLWAEAVYRYLSGEHWWLDEDMEEEQRAEAEMRTTEMPWRSNIENAVYDDIFKSSEFVPTQDILTRVINIEVKDLKQWQYEQVNEIMGAMGWEEGRRTVTVDGRSRYVRGWSRPAKGA